MKSNKNISVEHENSHNLELLKLLHEYFLKQHPDSYRGCGLFLDVEVALVDAEDLTVYQKLHEAHDEIERLRHNIKALKRAVVDDFVIHLRNRWNLNLEEQKRSYLETPRYLRILNGSKKQDRK